MSTTTRTTTPAIGVGDAPATARPRVPIDPIDLMGTPLHALTEAECVEYLALSLDRGQGGWVITANLDHVRRAQVDAEYRAMLDAADVVVADGMPLVWASRLQGTALPERVAGSNLISSLSARIARDGRSVFLLGGMPGSMEGAAAVLTGRCPGLVIAGMNCPPLGFEDDASYMDALRRELGAATPDVVYVALGSPKQERLIRRLREDLPPAWWIGVGISFSFLTGEVRRAPGWMQRCGLEWVHRLVQEPRRLARRYLVEGLPFAARLIAHALCVRVGIRRQAPSSDAAV